MTIAVLNTPKNNNSLKIILKLYISMNLKPVIHLNSKKYERTRAVYIIIHVFDVEKDIDSSFSSTEMRNITGYCS